MKNLFKFSFFFSILFVFSSLFIISPVFGATPTVKSTPVTPVVLAMVGIDDAKIVSQKDGVFNISFSISNGEGLQTGVKYGAKLVKESQEGQFIMDEKIYDESLTLNPNTTIKKEITYTAPTSLSGSYTLMLTSQNTSGFPFGIVKVGKVTLKSTTSGIDILPETCSLKVIGEKSNATYSLSQGVDIKPEESLKLTCTAQNLSSTSLTATPTYETRYRSSYGDVTQATGGDSTAITFKAGESKSVSVTLPKATTPQAYDVSFSLNTKDSNSNGVTTHYVLRGNSATIQSVSLDKDYYKGGENALVSFVYTPSADSSGIRFGASTSSAISAKVEVQNGNGKSCAKEQTQALTDQVSPKVDLTFSIKSKCIDPKIIVTLTDDKGTVLDQKEFNVKTTSEPKSNSNTFYILIILALLVIIILYTYMKKKNIPPTNPTNTSNPTDSSTPMAMIFFFLLIAVFGFMPAGKASAAGATVSVGYNNYAVISIDKSTYYYPTDSVRATGEIRNSSSGALSAGTVQSSVPDASALRDQIYYRSRDLSVTNTKTGTFSIPSTNGTYNTTFYLSAYIGSTTNNIPTAYGLCQYVLTKECNSPTISYYQHNNNGTYTSYMSVSGLFDTGKYVKTADATSTITYNYATAESNISFNVIAPTVDIKVFKTSDPSIPIPQDASKTTTQAIAPGTPIRLSWEAKGFNSNVVCTLPPNGTPTTAGTSFGQIDFSIGPNTTTTYNVDCDDGVTTTPPTYTYYKLDHCTSTSQYQTGPYLNTPYSTGRVLVGAVNDGNYNYTVIDHASTPYAGLTNIGVTDSGGNSCSFSQ